VIAPSAKKSSASDRLTLPGAAQLHLWLCRRELATGSDTFVREVLSRYLGTAPAALVIARGARGKPALTGTSQPLAFNLSDSGDWFALAISAAAPVGIDLEFCEPRRDVVKLARRYFASTELAQLQRCPASRRLHRFYDYWTLKEAHVKAFGASLAEQLKFTSFDIRYVSAVGATRAPDRIVALTPIPVVPAWYCLLQPAEDYRLALCCLAPQDFSTGLRLFELSGSPARVRAIRPVLRAVSAPAPTVAMAAGE
jgi:phosphopantetheinyl transferase